MRERAAQQSGDMNVQSTGVIHFDQWTLDPRSGELVHGDERIRLQEQPLQVLQALLERPGQVVTREELVERLWPTGVVDFETGLNTAMRRLRAALHDDAESPKYIETLPRRGYRFIGQVEAHIPRRHDDNRTWQIGATETPGAGDCLVVMHAPQQSEIGRRYPLNWEITTIGRDHENHVVLASQSVSRQHARIERRARSFYLVDETSTNGTLLNDLARPVREQRLTAGDELAIGDRILKYLTGDNVDAQIDDLRQRAALTDSLTGASNRRQFDVLLETEALRARRHNRPLSLLMICVEHLAGIQDRYGDLARDTVLRGLAALARKRLRPHDALGRYSSDSFCVLMPETQLSGAAKTGQALCELVAGHVFAAGRREIRATICVGAISVPQGMAVADIYLDAERKLSEAKRAAGDGAS
jgi:diguanylate cyclase (GGDEF)-like protein